MKLIFKSLGETSSTIQDKSYLKKGNVFDKIKTINPEYIDVSIENMAVFTLKFQETGFFLLQSNILIHPFDEKSINSLLLVNGKTNEETNLIKVYGRKSYIKQSYVINNYHKENYYNFVLNNDLGKTSECRVSDIEVFLA